MKLRDAKKAIKGKRNMKKGKGIPASAYKSPPSNAGAVGRVNAKYQFGPTQIQDWYPVKGKK